MGAERFVNLLPPLFIVFNQLLVSSSFLNGNFFCQHGGASASGATPRSAARGEWDEGRCMQGELTAIRTLGRVPSADAARAFSDGRARRSEAGLTCRFSAWKRMPRDRYISAEPGSANCTGAQAPTPVARASSPLVIRAVAGRRRGCASHRDDAQTRRLRCSPGEIRA